MNTKNLAKKATWQDYLELCKPRVVLLMLITAYVGMQLATPGFVSLSIVIWGLLGIALMASSAAVINHLVDSQIDALMARTRLRPLPTGKIETHQAIIFSLILGVLGFFVLFFLVNLLTAILTFFTLIGYALIYTRWLKRNTPYNIVLGGLAGSMPPLLGWVAVTNAWSLESWVLVAIIFIWTPPHFWALAIYRFDEYKKVDNIPMLPITHGIPFTKRQITAYSILLLLVSVVPFLLKMSGLTYLISAIILGLVFIYFALKLQWSDRPIEGRTLFRYSIVYLFLLFIALFVDHFIFYIYGA